MSKIAHYLQEHLIGEVVTSTDARKYFATDASIFNQPPAVVVYPRNEQDVRKTARFTWQLAERGRVIPLTARGAGTDLGGAAVGSGILMVFPAHMNRILELDGKSGTVIVEPGINYGRLQQTLKTHDRFLPPFPASQEYSTAGGAVANNAAGVHSVKYGDTKAYVKGLRVVLANGEVIETGRLSRREVSKKLGLSTFEGEIYRTIDTLFDEHRHVIEHMERNIPHNAAGYNLLDIHRGDGSMDLTPLFVGSQGTLGLITEITFGTEAYNPETSLMLATCDSIEAVQAAVLALRELPDMPSAIEVVDGNLLELVAAINPNQLKKYFQKPFPKAVLFVEFDNSGERHQNRLVKRATKALEGIAHVVHVETDIERQEEMWKVRYASATLTSHTEGHLKALPLIDDGIVPIDKLSQLMNGIYEIFTKEHLRVAVWGHAGEGNLHVQPFLNVGQVGDRQKAFRLMDEFYRLVITLGGSTSGAYNDGRLRAPYLQKLYGQEVYMLLQKIKQVCDPYGTLNPGVKIDVSFDDVKQLLRQDYSLYHLYDHLPRS